MMFKSGQHTMEERRRFLEHLMGKTSSDSTVRRLLWRLGSSRKKGVLGRWNKASFCGSPGG
jgi:hypothetical protein